MNQKKRAYFTLRPYYIDTERLFDIYSTVMDGYSDSKEIVEITRDNSHVNKKGNISFGFSVTALPLNSDLGTTLDMQDEHENTLQVKTTRKLSPCVLLNWMLDKMLNDRQFQETTTRWLKRPVQLTESSLGMPVLLEGKIMAYSARALKHSNLYESGLRGTWARYVDHFKNKVPKGKGRYILFTSNIPIPYTYDQQLRLEIERLQDMLIDFLSTERVDRCFFDKISSVFRLVYWVGRSGYLRTPLQKEDAIEALKTAETALNNFVEEYEPLSQKQAGTRTIVLSDDREFSFESISLLKEIILQCKEVTKSLVSYRLILADQREMTFQRFDDNAPNHVIEKYRDCNYTFVLRDQMFYDSSAEEILNIHSVKCFGLIKSIGLKAYELEVVALYQ